MRITLGNVISFFFAISVALLTIASTRADSRGAELAPPVNPDAMLADGRKLSLRGDKLVMKGEKLMTEGQKQSNEGEKFMKDGNKALDRAQKDYQEHSRLRGSAVEHKHVKDEAKRLKAIAKDWEDAIDDVRKGHKLVEKGEKKKAKARKQLNEGHALVDKGQMMIRNSELARAGELELVEPEINQ